MAAFAFTAWHAWWLSRRDSRRLTLEAIAQAAPTVAECRGIDVERAQREMAAFYDGDPVELHVDAAQYMNMLDALDRLALGKQAGLLDRKMLEEYFDGLLRARYLIPEGVLESLRKAQRDPSLYEHLAKEIARARR